MVKFKAMRCPSDVILVCTRCYAAYPLSYCHLDEMMQKRVVLVDHSSINRWQFVFCRSSRRWPGNTSAVGVRWRMGETYVKVKGVLKYLYRAIDKQEQTFDFLLAAKRDMAAAKRFFRQRNASELCSGKGRDGQARRQKGGDRGHQRRALSADVGAPSQISQLDY